MSGKFKKKPIPEKVLMGRPSHYKPEYCEAIIEFMKDGSSVTAFAASINQSKETVYGWARDGKYPDFAVAMEVARSKSEAHWEKIIKLKTVKKTEGSDSLLIFWMKNRFGWSDKKTDLEKTADEAKGHVTFSTSIDLDGSVKTTHQE